MLLKSKTIESKATEKSVILLNDLIRINNDRIICYQQAINKATNLDIDLRRHFKEMISEGMQFKQELFEKIKELHGNPKDATTISGMVHRAWVDLKVTFTGNTRNSIVNFCEYSELLSQHAYQVALNMLIETDADIYNLVARHHAALLNSYAALKKCHEARPYINPRLVYFN